MPAQSFLASTQYGDFTGSAMADRADRGDANEWLEKNGLKKKEEFLLGITLNTGENHGKHQDPITAEFLLFSQTDHDSIKSKIETSSGPVPVRIVSKKMTIAVFLGLFKRFSVYLSLRGMLDRREYICKE